MRKIFLIPLFALMCSVMAWGDNVAKIGDTEFATLQDAISSLNNASNKIAAGTKATIQLLANTTENVSIDMSAPTGTALTQRVHVTLDLNSKVLNSTITVTGAGSSTARDTLVIANGEFNGSVVASSTSSKNATLILANGVSSTTGISIDDNGGKTKFEVGIGTTSGDAISANLSIKLTSSKTATIKAGVTLTGNVTLDTKACLTILGTLNGNITAINWAGSTGSKLNIRTPFTGNLSFSGAGGGAFSLTENGQVTGNVTFVDHCPVVLTINGDNVVYNPASTTGDRGEATTNITAGTVNFEPTVDTATKAKVDNGDGTWTVTDYKAQIGETKYADFVAAYNAASSGATITLLQNNTIKANANFTKAVTTSGDYNLSVNDGVTVTFNNANTNIAKLGAYSGTNVTLTAGTYALSGFEGNLTINGATVTSASAIGLSGALAITGGTLNANVNLAASTAAMTMSNGTLNGNITTSSVYNTLNITGGAINGAINLTHFGNNLAIGGVTVVSENGPALRSMATNNLTISSGSYTNNGDGEVVEGGNGSYKLILQGGTYNKAPNAAYIPEGYEVVGSGPYTVQAAAAEFVSVSKNGGAAQSFSNMSEFIAYLPLENDGSTYTITLLRDYSMDFGDGLEIYSNNTCTLDLNGHQLTASGNNNKSKLLVGGTLILNANGGSIVIPNDNGISVLNGGKATINGGTFTTNETGTKAFYADAEGELNIIGATIDAQYGCAIYNKGNALVKNCEISSQASSHYLSYSYAVINAGKMSLINTNVTGVHGAVACQDEAGYLDIDGGVFRAEDSAENEGDAYGALYVATSSMVSAKNAKFYSDRENYAVLSGDNDSGKTFGIVNLYNNCYLSDKMHVSARKVSTAEVAFPVQLAESSAWYSSFGGEGPIPAGYEYTSSDIEGYAWKVVSLATETKEADDDPTATIPWQQSSTWDATKQSTSTEEVPAATTIVTIPADKVVVISADPNENNGVTEAKAEQIFISNGASLTVETGTTLSVGEGGVNISNGGSLTVQPGAIVTVGAAGLVTTEEDALVIEGTEEDQGVFLIAPAVTENTQPKATVKLVTKAKQVAANEFIWERFAIPTLDGSATIYDNEGLDTVHYYGDGTYLLEGLYEWSDAQQNWAPVSSWKNLQPFKGYQLTNNSKYGNVVYTFEGNLVGNADQNFSFAQSGFGFFGNSYSGDIDILKFFESFGEHMQKTVWIYDYYTDGFKAITESSYGTVYYGKRNNRHGLITDIRSMQAFIMNTFAEGESATSVDYSAAIWGNPKYGLVPEQNNAPKRVAANSADMMTVYVAGEKQEDEISFIRSDAYSSAFDNGADASKWMNNGINLYAVTENGEMAVVASDEIVDMTIAFKSGNESKYTLGFDNISGDEFSIRDILTGEVIVVAEDATYTFTQDPNTTIPARFQIIGSHKMPTDVENVEGATVQQKVLKNGNLYILRDNKWYSVQGQLVK